MSQSGWIGKTIAQRYLINALLGKGGMSAVYKATDPNLRREVAIKLIHTHLSDNPEFVRRFEEEATAVARLRHANIIQVYDFNHDGELYFIVFEYIPGETLQSRLQRLSDNNDRLPLKNTLKFMISMGEALAYAHEEGLVHRDIKPANIMINRREEAILMDFGIAKVSDAAHQTATGMVLGTARYMSPEQVMGEKIDARSDIYALGVTLFEMVNGRPPFESDSVAALMMKHVNEPIPDLQKLRPDVPPALVAVINQALAKDRAERYQTATAFVTNLEQVAASLAGVATTAKSPIAAVQETVIEANAADVTMLDRPGILPDTIAKLESTAHSPTKPPSSAQPSNRKLLLGIGIGAVVLIALLTIFALRPTSVSTTEFPANDTNEALSSESLQLSAMAGVVETVGANEQVAAVAASGSAAADSAAGASSESEVTEDTAVSSTASEFDPLFLTSYTYDGLTIAVALPETDTERILFSIDDPEPKTDNGRNNAGTLTLANNSIGPIPLDKGPHTLYLQYVDAQGNPSQIYTFDYKIDDIVLNFSQLPYDFETDGIAAIFTMAVVDGDPNALYTYAYSVNSEALDQVVEGVGQAGVIQLQKQEPGEHTLYVQATSANEQTDIVIFPFTIE